MKSRKLRVALNLIIVVLFTALFLTTPSSAEEGIASDVQDITITNSMTLSEDVAYDSVDFKSGTVNLNGFAMRVHGNLVQAGGAMVINGGSLIVDGDYLIQDPSSLDTITKGSSSGRLNMINDEDRVVVNGDFVVQSTYGPSGLNDTTFRAGTLEIKGNITQKAGTFFSYGSYVDRENNFFGRGTHKVVLSGTGRQIVTFETPESSGFNDLEITNPNPLNVIFASSIRGWVLQRDTVLTGVTFVGSLDLNGYNATIYWGLK